MHRLHLSGNFVGFFSAQAQIGKGHLGRGSRFDVSSFRNRQTTFKIPETESSTIGDRLEILRTAKSGEHASHRVLINPTTLGSRSALDKDVRSRSRSLCALGQPRHILIFAHESLLIELLHERFVATTRSANI